MNYLTFLIGALFAIAIFLCWHLGHFALRKCKKNISFKFSLWSLEFEARDSPDRQK